MTASPCDERRSSAACGRRRRRWFRRGAAGVGRDDVDDVPALVVKLDVADLAEPLAAAWPGPVAGTTYARSALRRRVSSGGVSMTTATAGRPASRAASQPGAAAAAVEAEGVDDGGQPAREAGGDDALEELERLVGGGEVVRAAADDAAQVVGRDDLAAR